MKIMPLISHDREKILRLLRQRNVFNGGARRIYVETSSTPPYEPARSLYKKHGYQMVCLLMDFYREGDHKMIFMKEVCGIIPQ